MRVEKSQFCRAVRWLPVQRERGWFVAARFNLFSVGWCQPKVRRSKVVRDTTQRFSINDKPQRRQRLTVGGKKKGTDVINITVLVIEGQKNWWDTLNEAHSVPVQNMDVQVEVPQRGDVGHFNAWRCCRNRLTCSRQLHKFNLSLPVGKQASAHVWRPAPL